MKIRIGTRGSKLALWQAYQVQDLLRENGAESAVTIIETKGDKILDVSLSKIGSKGVFTEEIEEQLKKGAIDIAVHSAKDLQSTLSEGFEIIAFGRREKPDDVLISSKKLNLESDALKIGTSSTRRVAMAKRLFPNFEIVPVRGNLQTRIKKMEKGACDALWLAYAGVHRMGYESMIVHQFDLGEIIPAVGQGCLAIEGYETLDPDKKSLIRKAINDPSSEICLQAERSFLRTMDGGCSIPVYGLASLNEEVLTLKGGIVSLNGKEQITKTCYSTPNAALKAGKTLGESILNSGGREILEKIKATI